MQGLSWTFVALRRLGNKWSSPFCRTNGSHAASADFVCSAAADYAFNYQPVSLIVSRS